MEYSKIKEQYSTFIIQRTYARYLPEEHRRETWDEIVDRYYNFLDPKVPCGMKGIFKEAVEAVRRKEVMPSMRLLWTAGKAAERENVCAYNCFSGDTEFVTTEGIKQLKETGKHNVMVADGSTIEADVYCFGKQTTKEVIFKRNSYTKVVKATDKHNWKLLDGTEKTTDQLVYGDKIKFVFNRPTINTKSIDYNLGIKHGFIYGDGTLQKRKNTYSQQRDAGYFIRVCSDIEDTLKYFGEYPVTYPKSFNGNPVIMMCDSFAKTHALKELPDENETLEYLLGFFRGWFAADGYISKQNQIRLTCKKEVIPWLNSVLPRLGIYTQRIEDLRTPTNFGERKQETINVFLDRATLIKDDFILPRKQMLFKPYKVLYYTFNSIDNSTAREEDVYCAVVPEYKEFVLNQGLLTGNCAYTAIDNLNSFSEIMYLLLNGVGVGFSVERQFIAKLPEISSTTSPEDAQTYIVEDSKEGWAKAFRSLIKDWYKGIPSDWDVSLIRPKGSLIKTFGGRASGSGVLVDLFNFTKRIIFAAQGRKLNSKELADIVCKTAEIIIAGGVRRSATIAFSNLSDRRMEHFKEGNFYEANPQRCLANISTAYTEKPDVVSFLTEFRSLIQSNAGERGIVNVESFPEDSMRLNPCGERVLRDKQFCNLTEVVITKGITPEELKLRVMYATVLGTVQASLTKFNSDILSPEWAENTIKDALLGVSLTGTANRDLQDSELQDLKYIATQYNDRYAKKMGINKAAGITCNKPSGTVSQVVGCASGIHADYAPYYIRRVRVARTDPIAKLLVAEGVPHNVEPTSEDTLVFDFPTKGNAVGITKNASAVEQLEYWKLFKLNWCDDRGNPSVTVRVKEPEWLEVANWVYNNWSIAGGLTFLPADNGVYQLAPYEEISMLKFEELCSNFPTIDFTKLSIYEEEDSTVGSQEYACSAGGCDIV